MKKTALVILAAGRSSRMDETKQLLPWKNTTLLGNAIENALQSNCNEVFVVLGYKSTIIKSFLLAYDITIIENKEWASGIGNSIGCAVKFVNARKSNFDTIILTLADMPFIRYIHYNELIEAALKNEIFLISSNIEGKASIPIIISKEFFDEFTKLKGDFGGKLILDKYRDRLIVLKNASNLLDIDTIENYTSALLLEQA